MRPVLLLAILFVNLPGQTVKWDNRARYTAITIS
ncbi:uncharacterized protein METZ01_LOCUS361938, partial [marine metagenome]